MSLATGQHSHLALFGTVATVVAICYSTEQEESIQSELLHYAASLIPRR